MRGAGNRLMAVIGLAGAFALGGRAYDTRSGYGGVSVSGTGATTRIALGVSGTWGNYPGQQIVQLSDDAGQTWREIEGGMPGQTASGWVDDGEIDPFNRDHVLHVHGGGLVETRPASSSKPTARSRRSRC